MYVQSVCVISSHSVAVLAQAHNRRRRFDAVTDTDSKAATERISVFERGEESAFQRAFLVPVTTYLKNKLILVITSMTTIVTR